MSKIVGGISLCVKPGNLMTRYPGHWPRSYNGDTEPCDTIDGLCSCGGWHNLTEEWVSNLIDKYGLDRPIELTERKVTSPFLSGFSTEE